MTIDDKIRDEKMPYKIDRETLKLPSLSSGKMNKYEYLTGQKNITFWSSSNNIN